MHLKLSLRYHFYAADAPAAARPALAAYPLVLHAAVGPVSAPRAKMPRKVAL